MPITHVSSDINNLQGAFGDSIRHLREIYAESFSRLINDELIFGQSTGVLYPRPLNMNRDSYGFKKYEQECSPIICLDSPGTVKFDEEWL